MEYIDLHTHSTASDGTLTPAQLAAYAAEKGLKAFALTDHDTTEGITEAASAAKKYHIELVPGIELSASWQGKDIHIVGLDIDCENCRFQEILQSFQDSREIRNDKMLALLRKENIDISRRALEEAFPDSVFTRAHFARFLLDNHYVGSMQEAFDRYLGDHAKCFVPREKVTPFQAISLIHEGGGKAVFAHPVLTRLSKDRLESLVNELKHAGLDAMETIYSTYTPSDELAMTQMAKRHGLKRSGGSDFHGSNKPYIDLAVGKGNLKIPYSILENLRN